MTKAIFWDNDGVLVDTEQLYFTATRQVMASAGIDLTEEQYIDLFLVQGRGAWHLAEARGIAPEQIERLRNQRNVLYGQWLSQGPRVLSGIADVLKALHGRYRMGVVTSSRKDHFDVIHRDSGLLKYFDFVVTAGDVSRVKPDPELYLRAIDRSGVDPGACVAIEDSTRGLEAARAAGIRCIVVPTVLTRHTPFHGADRVLDRVEEILTIL